jgi:hypothetical protein
VTKKERPKSGGVTVPKANDGPPPKLTREVMLAAFEGKHREQVKGELDRHRDRPKRPEVKATMVEGAARLDLTNADDPISEAISIFRLEDAFGSNSGGFMNHMLVRLTRLTHTDDGIDGQALNAALAVLGAVEPQNEMEALLGVQMVTADIGARKAFELMNRANLPEGIAQLGGLANKYMRTFTAQVEALAKLRRGGEQIVKHVHVYEGGQAVVAGTINQHQGGGGRKKDDAQSDATNAIAGSAALPCPDPTRDGMPISGDAERPLSHARRDEPGGAEG